MADNYDEEYDEFEPPEMDPPDPDAEDPRDFAKRRRRAPSQTAASQASVPSVSKVANSAKAKASSQSAVSDEDWGFEDDEEQSWIAEWKLGVGLVVVLLVGFSVVAWKKYDTIKALAAEKLNSLSGSEVAADADGKSLEAPDGDTEADPFANVALAPPDKPRTDGITVADSSLPPKQDVIGLGEPGGSSANTFLASNSSPTLAASSSNGGKETPVPPPADIGWGTPTKPKAGAASETKEPISFDFGPLPGEVAANTPKPAVSKEPAADPFGDVLAEPMTLAQKDEPKSQPKPSTSSPFDLAWDSPAEKQSTAPKQDAEPLSAGDPFALPETPGAAEVVAVVPKEAADTGTGRPKQPVEEPAADPFDLGLPDLTASGPAKPAPMNGSPGSTSLAPSPFDVDPLGPLPNRNEKPFPLDPPIASTRPKPPAQEPFAVEPLMPVDPPVATAPRTRDAGTQTSPFSDSPNSLTLDPIDTKPAALPADPFALPPSTPAAPAPRATVDAADPFALPGQPQLGMTPSNTREAVVPGRSTNPLPTPGNGGGFVDPVRPTTLPAATPGRPAADSGPQRVDIAIDTRKYTVGDGESFWTISKKQYGTVRYFAALAEHNRDVVSDPRFLRPGMKIELPPPDVLEPLVSNTNLPSVQPRPANVMASLRPEAHTARQHVVQSGENYWSISKKQYGTSRYFAALAEWNKRSVPNPRELRPGMTIELPAATELEPLIATASPEGPAPPQSTDTGAAGFFKTASGEPRYRVGRDESLSQIAFKMLGRASRADQIFAMNRDVLRSKDSLPLGVILKLPFDVLQTANR